MINSFTFNGISSEELGLYVGGQMTFGAPQRDVTKVSIPGRNGDLVRDNGRFLNAQVAYNIVAMDDFAETARRVRNWLNSVVGYARLEDTYDPEHYRMAMVASTIDFETSAYNRTGKAQIIFDCKPQRFLKLGENEILIDSTGTAEERSLTNPTNFYSSPLFLLERSLFDGEGTLTVGNQIIVITGDDQYLYIDSETMNCYNGSANRNSIVRLGANGFPTLPPGDTIIALAGDFSTVAITPRWWEL